YGLYPRANSFGANLPLIARVVVGQDVDYSSEAFSNGVDLASHQITFVPAVNYSDAADSGFPEYYVNHSNYTPTVSDGSGAKVAPDFDGTLPVPKEDIITIPLADESYIAFAPDVPFPFFGEFYNTLYLSANGFISPVAPGTYANPMDSTPTLENHFGKRRISFLFSDLDPGSGGLVWGRFLSDRMVVTFEDVPAFSDVAIPGASVANTVQVELFYNGTIRCTYLGLNAKRAVVGLSDGNGVPLDPADVIGNNLPASVLQTDFTSLSGPVDLELLPIPIVFATTGSTVEFTAQALSNIGAPTYSLEGAPAGATINPATGEFSWDSSGFSDNIYSFIVCATAGGVDACQLVSIWLSESSAAPVANNVLLTPAEPRDADSLILSYSYSHPSLPEGPTAIMWFKNGALIPAFNNVSMVPPGATQVGESWHCVVMPTTVRAGFDFYGTPIYLRGTPVQTEHVTILPDLKTDANKDGKVNSADLQVVVGKILGMQPEAIDGDVNSDGSTDVSDVQVIVNTILIGGD
ncbi:MAG: dockerin type I repeat-containing protein, partial [Candidatus Hydrogenedentes bacterium]|nr:dockerin type I repeat-containing protein [Candidatus Hydrogenedentota bacterium]